MPPLSPTLAITPRSLAKPFDAACARLDSAQFASALWSRQLDVWTSDPAVRKLIANRLGSNLAPEVLRQLLCPPDRVPRFHVLDSSRSHIRLACSRRRRHLAIFNRSDTPDDGRCSCGCSDGTSINSRAWRDSWLARTNDPCARRWRSRCRSRLC